MDEETDESLDSKTEKLTENAVEDTGCPGSLQVREGGWGWIVCCGTFIVNFIVFGIHNSFGVVYATLLDELRLGKAETAWIGAMAMGMNFLCGPLTSMLCDRYSCRATACVGGLLSVLGLFLTSFVQEPAKMYLTYGLLFGIGSSFSFVSSIVILGEYFNKRLAFVNGIATSGSGVGALVAGPVINYLLQNIGWQHCMRVLSGFAMLLGVAAGLYRSNKDRARTSMDHANPSGEQKSKKLLDITIWRNKAYVFWVVAVAMFQFGYLFPFVHLIKYSEELGIPTSKGAWLIGFLSIMSTVGRIVFGKFCDFKCVNRMFVYQFSVFAIGVSTLLCPLASSYAGLIGYALTFGFFDGCFVGQVAVITVDIVGHEKLSQGVGNMFGCIAVPMSLGPPVAGWLYEKYGSYNLSFYLSGGIAVVSSFFVFIVSYMRKPTPLTTGYAERRLIQFPNSDRDVKHENTRGSSGYSSRDSASRDSALDSQPLMDLDRTEVPNLSGPRMRDILIRLEQETVL